MVSESPKDWLGEFCICLPSAELGAVVVWSIDQPLIPTSPPLQSHHHVTEIVHGGNNAEGMVVNEVLWSFLPHLRYV